MQLSPEIISAIVGVLGGLLGSIATYWSQRPKIRSAARTEAEKADDLVFARLQQELLRRDERIDGLEKKLINEVNSRIKISVELAEVRRAFSGERGRRRRLEMELAEEKSLRITLEKRVAEQGKKIKAQAEQIKELQSENNNLHNQNRALATRLDTQELRRK